MKFLYKGFILFLIFISIFTVYFLSSGGASGDSRWAIHKALSIVREGNIDLDEFYEQIKNEKYLGIVKINGHLYCDFPYGTSLLISPLILVINYGAEFFGFDTNRLSERKITNLLELFMASFIVAITAVFIYLISQHLLANTKLSLLIVFIFAFCSPAWSTASQGLWQHGPSMLMLTVSLYLLLLAKENPELIQYVSIPLAFSYVIRPTNIISIFILSIYVLIQHKDYFITYFSGIVIVFALFFAVNFSIYASILHPYYLPQRIFTNHHFFEALLGNLVSPGRGLFIYSPVFILSFFGFILKIKNKEVKKIDIFLIFIIFFHWIIISSFAKWWAGWSFGPRFFSDMIPYFTFFLVFFVKFNFINHNANKKLLVIFLALIVFSFVVNFRGANYYRVFADWNGSPANIDNNPLRVWDWRDISFFR